MFLHQFFTEGLGHASYLIGSDESGEAAVIDPRLDLRPYLELARERKLQIRYALETHLHNDFVSGAAALAHQSGVEHVASAESKLKAPDHPVREGDELRLGELDSTDPIAVVCGSGYRSSAATSILQRNGFATISNTLGGMTAWDAAQLPTTHDETKAKLPASASSGRRVAARRKGEVSVGF